MNNLAEKAFQELFPNQMIKRKMNLTYSKAFKDYNANVKYSITWMKFKLSHKWSSVSEEIQIGLIQTLLLKVYKTKTRTMNMDLYESFLRNMSTYAKVDDVNPVLRESFDRVNEKYLNGMMDVPNLKWGSHSFAKLGSYEYGNNSVVMSKVLEEDNELLDYVMYHELLHKKHKFRTRSDGSSHHHTKAFKDDEKKFENQEIEKKLESFLRRKRYSAPMRAKKGKKKTLLDWFLS